MLDLTCAKLCEESYRDSLPSGFVEDGDLRFGIRETEDGTIVCIRGTANLANAVRDIRFLPARSPSGAWAHRGFVSGYERLRSLVGTPPEAIFTGHSFGAAVALLFAEALGTPVVTFGCPRVYLKWGKAPAVEHRRYVCDDDPVTMIPRVLYRHLCEPILLKDGDREFIDVRDHSISVYLRRLEGELRAAV